MKRIFVYLNNAVLVLLSDLGINTTSKPDKNPKIITENSAVVNPNGSANIPTITGPNAPPPADPIPHTIPDDILDVFFGTKSPIKEIINGKRL